jgi:hypothetical protein
MTIKTKYNIGDIVWVIHASNVIEGRITKISIAIENTHSFHYTLSTTLGYIVFREEKIFKSKQALLKSL